MTSYIIDHHSEETLCEWCGTPLSLGDIVFVTPDDRAVCCKHHAHELKRYQRHQSRNSE